jgi:hypothetical protein
VNRLGGVHKLNSGDTSFDTVITEIGGSTQSVKIPAAFRTRQFNFKNTERKKWNSFEMQVESSDAEGSNFDIAFNLENINDTIDAGKMSDYLIGDESETASDQPTPPTNLPSGESVSIRGRIGNRRAYGIDIELTNFDGRPKIEVVKVTGGLAFQSTQPAK